MDDQLEDNWLDARLRDEAVYIDDDGFSARVMQQLPVRRRSHSSRSAILVGASLIACGLAYLVSGRGGFLVDSAEFLVAMPFTTVCFLAFCISLLVMGLGATAAITKLRRG